MSLASLILLRHGETEWNAERRLQGHRDIALNATGLRQAAAAAPSITALAPEVVLSSDLRRAHVTATTVAERVGLSVTDDVRLRETGLGRWEGLTWQDAAAGWPDEWAAWRSTSAHTRPPGGESRWEVAARAAAVVNELDTTVHQRALLVAHGGTIAGLTGRLAGAAGRALVHVGRHRQLPLGGTAPDFRRPLAPAFLQRRARCRRAARR